MAPGFDHPVYKDIRSPEHPAQRYAKLSHKYYSYRGVHPSWVSQPVYSIPTSVTGPPGTFPPASNDPLVTHPHALRIREWTKRDQYQNREFNIWPLDRKTHKVGRRHRGRGCDYVPPRWAEERSMKSRHRELQWEVELAIVENAGLACDLEAVQLGLGWDPAFMTQPQEGFLQESWDAEGTWEEEEEEEGEGDASACSAGSPWLHDPQVDSDSDFDIVSYYSETSSESCWEIVDF